MKKIFSILAVLVLLIAFYPSKVDAQKVEAQITITKINASKLWVSRCPNSCQWDTQADCGDRGAIACSIGNTCGNCNN